MSRLDEIRPSRIDKIRKLASEKNIASERNVQIKMSSRDFDLSSKTYETLCFLNTYGFDKYYIIWFNEIKTCQGLVRIDENVVDGLLDDTVRKELYKFYGWSIYDIEGKLDDKCITGGVVISKYGLSKEEILREF